MNFSIIKILSTYVNENTRFEVRSLNAEKFEIWNHVWNRRYAVAFIRCEEDKLTVFDPYGIRHQYLDLREPNFLDDFMSALDKTNNRRESWKCSRP